ncbi:MAG: NAD-dependent epimerase/dehydratase family protein [Vicinamibacteria bacterium]
MSSRNALVTGAAGFVGRHLSRQLSLGGWKVTGIGHGAWLRDDLRRWGLYEWHQCDINLETLLTYAGEPELIFHCAGSGSVTFSVRNPYQDYRRTVETLVSTLEYARMHAPHARIVYPSSAAVYGVARVIPMAEGHPLNPVSPYGVHKKIAEDLCFSYARHHGVRIAVIRFFSLYGTELRKQLLWDACTKVTAAENQFFGTGEEVRDWLQIDDAVSLLMTAAEAASTDCPVLNGGTGVGVGVRELLSVIFERLGSHDEPTFANTARSGDPTRYVADVTRARSLGWRPVVDWEEGVRKYVDWYRDEARKGSDQVPRS